MLSKTAKYILPILLMITAFLSAGVFGVAAEETEVPIDEPSAAEPSYEEPSYEEPSYEEPSYVEPTEEVTEPAWTPAAPVETQAPATEAGGYVEPDNGNSNDNDSDIYTPAPANPAQDVYLDPDKAASDAKTNNSVKMNKSVSDKSYSTDYTAGVVSWICVGVGIVVIIVMLVSTKIQGARMARRRV